MDTPSLTHTIIAFEGYTIAGTDHADGEVCWEWQVWRVREWRQIVWGGMERTGRNKWHVGR